MEQSLTVNFDWVEGTESQCCCAHKKQTWPGLKFKVGSEPRLLLMYFSFYVHKKFVNITLIEIL